MVNHRLKRLASDITKYIGTILITETDDKILQEITIIDTEVVKDLSYATVYFTSLLSMPHNELEDIVNGSASFIRGKLAPHLEIRNIPKLRFVYDTSIEYANKIEGIIKDINEG